MWRHRLYSLLNGQVEDSTVWDIFFTHLKAQSMGPPSLIPGDREMVICSRSKNRAQD